MKSPYDSRRLAQLFLLILHFFHPIQFFKTITLQSDNIFPSTVAGRPPCCPLTDVPLHLFKVDGRHLKMSI